MNNLDLDTQYYTTVLLNSYTNSYYFTVPKRLLDNNGITEPLLYYRLGDWKTKEIFKAGKLTKANTSLNKHIPLTIVNKLHVNKDDVLCIKLEKDIIWIEKIDVMTYTRCKFKLKITRTGNSRNRISIPTICREIFLLDLQADNITLDFLGIINNNVKIKNYPGKSCVYVFNKLINQLDLEGKELYCLLEKDKLTIVEEKQNEGMGKI